MSEVRAFLAVLLVLLGGNAAPREAPPGPSSAPVPGRVELGPGLVLERVRASREPAAPAGNGLITLVRIDPSLYRLRLLTAEEHGPRTAPRWLRDFGLTGVINASMYAPDLRSTGLMVAAGRVNNARVNSSFGAFFAFGPRRDGTAPVGLFGRGCPGFDLAAVRSSYGTVVQNYRMLDCGGRAIAWQDPKAYSVAAIGMDRQGHVVFIHSRTPFRMRDFNAMIAEPALGITAAAFVEGGNEASLYVATDGTTVAEVGSYDSDSHPNDFNRVFWPIPNVIGFAPIDAGATDSTE